ncbi:acyl-CoA synthetase [Paenalcaligenes suwonensis]|uniref:acyl-CoA synthetase n=1 Tax=Paenalcaligenes suwonensis TaxID=1202713 RepID=UPI00140BC78D|nr:acyl-CoA synthetase [Paenalcaligenes suwonensis]NHC62072.1 AMP-binding protein [Paenalcaligenes suwonensis]
MLSTVKNLGSLLTDVSHRLPHELAYVQGTQRYTWQELNARVDAMAHALQQLGVGHGDKILVHSKNRIQLFESCWVAFKLGAVWVPTNVRITEHEISYLAQHSGASVIIYDEGYESHVLACHEASTSIKHVIAIGEPNEYEHGYEKLIASHRPKGEFQAVDVQYDDPLWFFYTSGTTGMPKAGILTHGQMAFVITNHLADLMPGLTHQSRSLVVAPLSHGAGIHALVNVARGAASIVPAGSRLEPEEVWALVEKYGVDNMFTVPTIVKILVEHDSVDRYDHSSLKYVIYAGAPMYRSDQKHALQKLGKVLVQYYGLGEVTGNITVLPAALHDADDSPDARVGTCGYARTGMEVAILDEEGRRLAPFETGEICVRGPAVFKGYDNNDKANAEAFRFGWFHTGDIGHMDAQQFLYITGRHSDMYISGGSNVYPREIEEIFLTHDQVSEIAVLGIPDEKWGEVGVAVIVPKAGTILNTEEMQSFIQGRVARYKQPTHYFFWEHMPKSGYGKIVKKEIRKMLSY